MANLGGLDNGFGGIHCIEGVNAMQGYSVVDVEKQGHQLPNMGSQFSLKHFLF
jgi:hypothetical protein